VTNLVEPAPAICAQGVNLGFRWRMPADLAPRALFGTPRCKRSATEAEGEESRC
jgi:hypothetical protein